MHAVHSTAKVNNVTIFSNTKLREILEFSVIFPSSSKLKVLRTIFSNTFYIAIYTITMGVACPLQALDKMMCFFVYRLVNKIKSQAS